MDVSLHEKQSLVFNDPHLYKVVAAGRRFGKSYLAAVMLFIEGAKTEKVRSDGSVISLINEVVYYVGPTFKQARENLWNVCMELGQGLIAGVRANEGEIQLTNGRIIRFKGADDPDSLRGVGLSFVVMDEYAFMKPSVWEYIILPALARAEGGAMFIGTPAGKNHFYQMWIAASKGLDPSSGNPTEDWVAFQFRSADNPHLTENVLEKLANSTSEDARKQELEASFEATGGQVFNYDMFPVIKECKWPGVNVMAVDLAGFSAPDGKNKSKVVLDDHAFAIVRCHEKGYHIERIIHGRWDVKETAARIFRAYRKFDIEKLGIETGMARTAVETFLEELQLTYNTYFEIHQLKHNNNRKQDRIKWALQGRADRGEITLQDDQDLPAEDKWIGKFLGQAVDFPNPQAHDDLIDAAAYAIDQLAETGMGWSMTTIDEWQPLDDLTGW